MKTIEEHYEHLLKDIRFIDLFAGIGGFRTAFEAYGAKCVFSSEINIHARKTYTANYGEEPQGDITQINEEDIPEHDVLCAGFPCQAFSISGKQLGFEDARGTLFFDVARIIRHRKPPVVFLENVNNLEKHDGGKTLEVILGTLKELGYVVHYKVLNASHYGSAQSRKRIYIIALRQDIEDDIEFSFPKAIKNDAIVKDILLGDEETNQYVIDRPDIKIDEVKSIETKIKHTSARIGTINKGGQGERIYSIYGKAITLSAEGGGPAAKTGAYLVNGKIRKLAPRECLRLQGFPDDFKIVVSDSQMWKQAGNSVCVNVLKYIIRGLIEQGAFNLILGEELISMEDNIDLVERGSKTAKDGFRNEHDVVRSFNNWKTDEHARQWLVAMGYDLDDIEKVEAEKIKGTYKADVQARVTIYLKSLVDAQNLSVKLVSNTTGFNQVDKRKVDTYQDMWNIPEDVAVILKKFTGVIEPENPSEVRDARRTYFDEMTEEEREKTIKFFNDNKIMIITDVLKGRGKFAAEWMLVIIKGQEKVFDKDWILKPMNVAMNFFGDGEVRITDKGGLKLGRITVQRKGGDNGRETAKTLQFKIDPLQLFELDEEK